MFIPVESLVSTALLLIVVPSLQGVFGRAADGCRGSCDDLANTYCDGFNGVCESCEHCNSGDENGCVDTCNDWESLEPTSTLEPTPTPLKPTPTPSMDIPPSVVSPTATTDRVTASTQGPTEKATSEINVMTRTFNLELVYGLLIVIIGLLLVVLLCVCRVKVLRVLKETVARCRREDNDRPVVLELDDVRVYDQRVAQPIDADMDLEEEQRPLNPIEHSSGLVTPAVSAIPTANNSIDSSPDPPGKLRSLQSRDSGMLSMPTSDESGAASAPASLLSAPKQSACVKILVHAREKETPVQAVPRNYPLEPRTPPTHRVVTDGTHNRHRLVVDASQDPVAPFRQDRTAVDE